MGRLFSVICLVSIVATVSAQESLIETVLRYKTSMVEVTAVKFETAADGRIASHYQKGAGVIVDPSGVIVTNLHIVKFAEKVGIKLFDQKQVGAHIIHLMPQHDLALLKISPPYALTAIPFADSNRIALGEEVVNIGNSFYLKNTISGGRVTGLGRSYSSDTLEIIQVNMDLYEGDSGGPLLNREGELIGMMSAKRLDQHKVSFAIPSNKIKKLFIEFRN